MSSTLRFDQALWIDAEAVALSSIYTCLDELKDLTRFVRHSSLALVQRVDLVSKLILPSCLSTYLPVHWSESPLLCLGSKTGMREAFDGRRRGSEGRRRSRVEDRRSFCFLERSKPDIYFITK